ncbi:hypothetical protein GW17_00024041 [Ensete ventricosum]|nr:hypothetical protein GW17_00024041 [Ensete ventricosum]
MGEVEYLNSLIYPAKELCISSGRLTFADGHSWVPHDLSKISQAREALRSVSDGTDLRTDLPDATVELNSSNFDRVLKESPASFAIVEFFAHW